VNEGVTRIFGRRNERLRKAEEASKTGQAVMDSMNELLRYRWEVFDLTANLPPHMKR
jgi:hypothetical protein